MIFCHRTAAFVLLGMLLLPSLSHAETRGFVIHYLHLATHKHELNCPNGDNGGFGEARERAYRWQGFSEEKLKELFSGQTRYSGFELERMMYESIKKNGKPVSVKHYPWLVPDQHLATVQGPEAFGFDLDGLGAEDKDGFIDPETGEVGVDNQVYRAMGCFREYDIDLPLRPSWADAAWVQMTQVKKMPAWVFAISADDLGTDGEATVSFYRAVGRHRLNPSGGAVANMTFVVNPNHRTYGEFKGTIKNGVFTSDPESVDLMMEGGFPIYIRLALKKARLRLNLQSGNEKATGYVAGYQPWLDFWYYIALNGYATDIGPSYQMLEKFADGDPDPETGANTTISGTYRIDAVPAFLAHPDGTLITGDQKQSVALSRRQAN